MYSVGVQGLTDGIGGFTGGQHGCLQYPSLDQLSGLQLGSSLGNHTVRHAALAHHQSGLQGICLRAEFRSAFTCQH